MKRPRLGKGKNMSIPKAALVWWFTKSESDRGQFWDWGDYGFSHEIVEIAGAKQCSFFTSVLVSKELARSSYWNKEYHSKFYSGHRGGASGANLYTPSQKGIEYYKKHLLPLTNK